MIKSLIIGAVVMLGVVGVYILANSKNTTNASNLSMQTISADTEAGGQLIDVRTAEEYASGHIEGSVNLSLQDIQAGKMPAVAKDKPVYLYCRSGSRSGQAVTILETAGYRNIVDLGAMTYVQSLGGVIKP